MTAAGGTSAPALRRSIRASGYFALVFGQMVGSGWLVVLGVWLAAAGPLGAVTGLVLGGAVMLMVCLCYCELAARMPRAEGEVLYVSTVFGANAGFMLAWFLTVYYIALCAFEGIALTWLLTELLPLLRGPDVYTLLSEPVAVGGLAIGLAGAVSIGVLNYRGAAVSIFAQRLVTYSFLVLSVLLIAVGLWFGDPRHLTPLFHASENSQWWQGSLWILASSALFISGFQVVTYTVEERHEQTSMRAVAVAAAMAVVAGTAFYSGIVLSAASATPWLRILGEELPAVAAFSALTNDPRLGSIVLGIAALSLAKTWNSLAIAASRLIFGQARLGFLPKPLAAVHPRFGSPFVAVVVVSIASYGGIMLGRGAVIPILNMGALCVSLTFAACLAVLLRLRAENDARPSFSVPGGRVTIAATLVTVIGVATALVYQAWRTAGDAPVPPEIALIAGWGLLGAVVLLLRRRRQPMGPAPSR